MGQKRSTTIVLIVAALLVWGGVAVRITRWTRSDGPMEGSAPPIDAQPEMPADTLLLDYPDPFLGYLERQETASPAKADPVSVSEDRPPVFRYKGVMRTKEDMYALIQKGNMSQMLRRGDVLDGWQVSGFGPDAMVLKKGKWEYERKVEW